MKRILLIFAILFSLSSLQSVYAQQPGDLLVTPTRAVFEGGKRLETLTLINRGSDTTTYRISVIQYRMTREGDLQRIDTVDTDQHVATDMIRFFPREVTIAPGETQNVRVQIRTSDSTTQGEYRSHLFFKAIPKTDAVKPISDTTKNEFAVNLKAVFGVSVPVIVRVGQLNASVSVSDVRVQASDSLRATVSMILHRSGARSVYGAIRITYVSNTGVNTRLASIGGVGVYTPNTERVFRTTVRIPSGLNLKTGTVRVDYESLAEINPEPPVSATAQQ